MPVNGPVCTRAGACQSQSTLGEVVVTATRRETTLQDTPLAISAFDQATLDENRVVSLLDVRGLVPNLQFFENGDHAVPLIFIRGLGTRNQTEAGDQGIAFYSDGVFAARSQGTTVMLYDLDRIEVLRGPQGTLFGRNATGGAIAVHTAKPDASGFDASGEIVSGSDSLLGFRGMVNIPIGDKWALRAAGAIGGAGRAHGLRRGQRVRDQPQVRHDGPQFVPHQLDVPADREHQLVPRPSRTSATRAPATSAAWTSTTA